MKWAKFTFAPSPVLENESQQNPTQNIDDPAVWFTFDNDTIGNGDTITSGVPYVTVRGSGNGTFDDFAFDITQEMLSREAGDLTGSTPDNKTYYSTVTFNLTGGVGAGDEWTVRINGVTVRFQSGWRPI